MSLDIMETKELLISKSCAVIDFGEVYFTTSSATISANKTVTIKNVSATHSISLCRKQLEDQSRDFPLEVKVRIDSKGGETSPPGVESGPLDVESSFPDLEVVLAPLESVNLLLSLSSAHQQSQPVEDENAVAVEWSKRTSFFKVNSTLHFQYKICSDEAGDVRKIGYVSVDVEQKPEEVQQEKGEEPQHCAEEGGVLEWKFVAQLCTSVLFLDESDIQLNSCVINESYTRAVQIWNRSECKLQCNIELLNCVSERVSKKESANDGGNGTTKTDEEEKEVEEESAPLISFIDSDTDQIVQLSNTVIEVAPFASKRILTTFTATKVRTLSVNNKLKHLGSHASHPSKVVMLFFSQCFTAWFEDNQLQSGQPTQSKQHIASLVAH